jgi:CheY-like chemotaxis protein
MDEPIGGQPAGAENQQAERHQPPTPVTSSAGASGTASPPGDDPTEAAATAFPNTSPHDSRPGLVRPRGTVLVAENEENNRLLMEQILSLAGFQYVSATNGLEVLEVLDRLQVDVVLLDLSMPVLDGYRTAQMIRQRPGSARLPVVAVTGYALDEDRAQALDVGCTDYLAKPFRPHELLSVVERMLRLRGEDA